MFLSIIIPVYNLENYISRCLDSCLNQNISKDDYEIICVNDGSKDNSLSVLQDYAKKHSSIRIIDKKNEGVSIARNTGIAQAKGDYIWFVDGDDWINEDSLELVKSKINALETTPDQVVFDFHITCSYINQKIDFDSCESVFSKDKNASSQNSYGNSVCTKWYKTDILKDNDLCFKCGMKYGEDTLFLTQYRLYCQSSLVLNAQLYYYFQRPGSAMNSLNITEHSRCMIILNREYKKILDQTTDANTIERMRNGRIRSMQVFCRNICMYCGDRKKAKDLLSLVKKHKLYPFGIDKGNFRRDRKQSLQSDVLNWFFALLSFEPYFWICWLLCRVIFKSKTTNDFDVSVIEKELNED